MQRPKKIKIEADDIKLNVLQEELLGYIGFLKQRIPTQFNVTSKENIIKTGFLLYDEIIGGIPIGKYILISSQEGQGKTTLMVQLQAVLQKQQYKTMYLDTESSMSERRMQELGMDINNTIYLVPDCLEDQYILMVETMKRKEVINDNTPFVFCFDSNTQTPIRQELEDDELKDKQPGQVAKINSIQLRKIIKPLQRTNSTLIMISQLREKINMGFGQNFGPKEQTTGGKQLRFYAHQDIILQEKKSEDIMERLDLDGKVVSVKQKKNRIASPNIEFYMQLDFKKGFSDQISNFVFLSQLKDQDWKDSGFEYIPFKNIGGWYEIQFENTYTKKFRSREFVELYEKDNQFNTIVKNMIVTYIRTKHKNIVSYIEIIDEDDEFPEKLEERQDEKQIIGPSEISEIKKLDEENIF